MPKLKSSPVHQVLDSAAKRERVMRKCRGRMYTINSYRALEYDYGIGEV
jgi:hypothetical protein